MLLASRVIVACTLIFISHGCILPPKNMKFKGLAKRSEVVLQVATISTVAMRAEKRYKARFRVIGTFSDKFGQFKVNDFIRLGPFGETSPCVPVEVGKRYIVFLKKKSTIKKTTLYKFQYTISFNPVLLTENNLAFFDGIISGKVNDVTTKRLLSSGCPILKEPLNGTVKCTNDWKSCSIKCEQDFELSCEDKVLKLAKKACSPTTGLWEPPENCNCIKRSTQTNNNSDAVSQKTSRNDSDIKIEKDSQPSNVSGNKENAIEEKEVKTNKKPWKQRTALKSTRKPKKQKTGLKPKNRPWKRKTASKLTKKPWKQRTASKSNKKPWKQRTAAKSTKKTWKPKATSKSTKKPWKPKTTSKSTKKPWKQRKNFNTKPKSDTVPAKLPRKKTDKKKTAKTSVEGKSTGKPWQRRNSKKTRGEKIGNSPEEKIPKWKRNRATKLQRKASPARQGKKGIKTIQPPTKTKKPLTKEERAKRRAARLRRRQKRLRRLQAKTSSAASIGNTTTPTTLSETTSVQTIVAKRVFVTRTPPVSRIPRITTQRPIRPGPEQPSFFGIRQITTKKGNSHPNSKFDENKTLMSFGESVVGCPTINGNFKIHSIWKGGFNGMVRFEKLPQAVRDGWLLKITFNVPLYTLNTFTVDPFPCDRTMRSYCLIPKEYDENINAGSDLTVSFTGDMSGITVAVVRGKAQLMGACQTDRSKNRRFRDLIPPIPNIGNINETLRENGKDIEILDPTQTSPSNPTVTIETPSSTVDRCGAKADNGHTVKDHAEVTPHWRKLNNSGMDYNEILHKSILFYEAQRSGRLPDNNRVPWRGDADMKDGCSMDHDLSGGWYNSGGNVKTTLLIAFSTTMLAWGAIDYKDAYQEAGEYEHVMDQIHWAADYLIKCRTSPYELVVQISDYTPASSSWKRPEESTQSYRKVYVAHKMKPAGDVAAETAAALAAVSILFAESEPTFAEKCLEYARDLYIFAKDYPEHYPYNPRSAAFWYNSKHGSHDELTWAGVWLYRATQEESYLNEAENMFKKIVYNNATRYHFSWNHKAAGITTLLASFSNKPNRYKRAMRQFVAWTINDGPKTPQGLIFLNTRTPNMHAANSAFLCLQAAGVLASSSLTRNATLFAKQQMKILTGVNGQGYVVGVGLNGPRRPHHRGSSCPPLPTKCYKSVIFQNKPNANTLYGALIGGPTKRGRYFDRASDYIRNNVRIDFNAGFQSLAAGLLETKLQAKE